MTLAASREDTLTALEPVHLRRGGTSVVIDLEAPSGPAIVHWGRELTASTSASLRRLADAAIPQRVSGGLDTTGMLSVLPTPARGWFGTPAVEVQRDGRSASLQFALRKVTPSAYGVEIDLVDAEAEVGARVRIAVGVGGVVHQQLTIRNDGSSALTVLSALVSFPVPWEQTEILDTTGRHLRERTPQRRPFTFGTHLRESRRGRPGADATLLLAAGRPAFGFESGMVHGIHVAWSGNHRVLAERAVTGEAFLAGGELLSSGEIALVPGDSYEAPTVLGSWGDGLDELSHRFHTEWRARPQHPRRPRPVTINTWEAVYFDHTLDRLHRLADASARVGVERFVLDDGWFHGRRDDTAGLGDWFVDATVWPDGLHPLVDHVRALGMEFGLWVEPEMVNPDSDLARAHPDWILRGRAELPPLARQQQVLDLSHPAAYDYIAERLLALLAEYPIAYLKWDHNRDLVDAGGGPGTGSHVHAHTLALYRLIDMLKQRYPDLEIESCASGGARVDLGILDRTDRIWTSDCLDPIERLGNQRYTALVVPPEMMGMHLTSPVVHSTHRAVDLGFSAAVALFGHFGVEWDLTTVDDVQSAAIGQWIALAKRLRPLVATGRVVNVDGVEPGIDVRGMVSDDGASAVFTISQIETTAAYPPGRIRLPGLSLDDLYRVRILAPADGDISPGQSPLRWMESETVLTGEEWGAIGVRPPVQFPQRATVLELVRIARQEAHESVIG